MGVLSASGVRGPTPAPATTAAAAAAALLQVPLPDRVVGQAAYELSPDNVADGARGRVLSGLDGRRGGEVAARARRSELSTPAHPRAPRNTGTTPPVLASALWPSDGMGAGGAVAVATLGSAAQHSTALPVSPNGFSGTILGAEDAGPERTVLTSGATSSPESKLVAPSLTTLDAVAEVAALLSTVPTES
jgi:hypothetical protein